MKNVFYYAYDKSIKRRVPFVRNGDTYISLVTGTKFKHNKQWRKE